MADESQEPKEGDRANADGPNLSHTAKRGRKTRKRSAQSEGISEFEPIKSTTKEWPDDLFGAIQEEGFDPMNYLEEPADNAVGLSHGFSGSDDLPESFAIDLGELEGADIIREVIGGPPPSKDISRKALTEQYQPYVRSIAGKIKKTLSKDIEFDDLVQYGMMGLFEASDRFDAKFGANFMTFAYYRIRGAIYDGLRGMGWVSRTEYQRYRFEMQANSYLTGMNDQTVSSSSSSKASHNPEDEVGDLADVVTNLVTIYVTALDAMEGFQIKDERAPSVEEALEILQARKLIAEAVTKLPDQEKTLLKLYYYQDMSLENVGKRLGLSKSWTSRLHTRAIQKLSRLLTDLVIEYQGVTGMTPKNAVVLPTGPPEVDNASTSYSKGGP